jgi:hypothetical protein
MRLNGELGGNQSFSLAADMDRSKMPTEKDAQFQTLQTSQDVSWRTDQVTSSPNASLPDPTPPMSKSGMSEARQNLLLLFMSLSQLLQMITVGVGINSGPAIGAALRANAIQSVWVVASYPLTQGSFVLIGTLFIHWALGKR